MARQERAWLSICRSSKRQRNSCTSSPEETTSTPIERISSSVPASTRERYGMPAMGKYSMASRRPGRPASMRSSPARNDCQEA
jgi:hypothetical protein